MQHIHEITFYPSLRMKLLSKKNSYRISIPHGLISFGDVETECWWCYLNYGRNMYVCMCVLCCILNVRHILRICSTIIIIIDMSSVWLYLLLWHIVFIDFLFLLLPFACTCAYVCVYVYESFAIVRIHDDVDDDIVSLMSMKTTFSCTQIFYNLNIKVPFFVCMCSCSSESNETYSQSHGIQRFP